MEIKSISMEIKPTNRPWQRKQSQGNRINPDPFYQSKEWKQTRIEFISSQPWQELPPLHNIPYSNKYCVECWNEGKIKDVFAVDHIQRKRAGGERTAHTNLQSLCKHHHAVKSAKEANEKK